IVPTTADALSGVARPSASAAPLPISTAALALACNSGLSKPIEPNQPAVPSSVRACRTPCAIIVPARAARRMTAATSPAVIDGSDAEDVIGSQGRGAREGPFPRPLSSEVDRQRGALGRVLFRRSLPE